MLLYVGVEEQPCQEVGLTVERPFHSFQAGYLEEERPFAQRLSWVQARVQARVRVRTQEVAWVHVLVMAVV